MKTLILTLVTLTAMPALAEEASPALAKDQAPAAVTVKPEPAPTERPTVGRVGLLMGNASVRKGGGNHLTFGARADATFARSQYVNAGTGVHVGRISTSTSASGLTVDLGVTHLMFELTAKDIMGSGLYLGGRGGYAYVSTEISGLVTASDSTLAFIGGPAAGYDLKLSKEFSVGVDISYLTLSSTTFVYNGLTTVTIPSISAVLIQGGVSLHF